ncbi:MAG: hypothetical protein ACK5DE_10035 [Bacteroidota bacterium]|jgi:hypothetical protein
MEENQANMSEQIQQRLKEKCQKYKETVAQQEEQIELLKKALSGIIWKSAVSQMTKAEKLQQIHDIAQGALDKLKGGTS